MSWEVKNSALGVGDQFEAKFFLNAENEDINALEGKIVWPANLIELQAIRDGNSIIDFWVERPRAKNGEIIFSGIIPGGYLDNKGLIFSAVFQALSAGSGAIEISSVKALLNDGRGTAVKTTGSNWQFTIAPQTSSTPLTVETAKDADPPEAFEPLVASDSAMFDGKYFLVFAAQDKGSGIDYYEICEGEKKCVNAESPYLLKNQALDDEIVVYAIDKSGNERTAAIPAQKPRAWYKDYAIFAILIIATIAYLIGKFLWPKRKI